MKLSPAVTGMLKRREAQLVEHFIAKSNKQLAAQLAERKASGELKQLRTRGTLSLAVKLRLQMIAPLIDTWPQALAVATQPRNAPHALGLLGELVDEVWAAAGDTSADMSWYTKRALLAGVYTSTELYMLTDFSPEFTDTWQALERRLDDAMSLGKAAGSVKASAETWAQAAAAAAQAAAANPSRAAAAAQAAAAAAANGGSVNDMGRAAAEAAGMSGATAQAAGVGADAAAAHPGSGAAAANAAAGAVRSEAGVGAAVKGAAQAAGVQDIAAATAAEAERAAEQEAVGEPIK